jgi:hypothetical protein
MKEILIFAVIVVAWYIVQAHILPKLGFST